MFQEAIKQYVLNNTNLVTMRESPVFPGLFVLKYKKTVFFRSLWNEYLEQCRGTVVDKDFNIVSYPFTKIYNYGIEKSAPILDGSTPVTAYRKVNGFMVAISFHKGDVLVSTTGSTSSSFVDMAKEMMLTHAKWEDWQLALCSTDMQNMTFMFECVHPNDPHIIPEKAGMYILGYRENKWNSPVGHNKEVLDSLAEKFNCYAPERCDVTVEELQSMTLTCKHEGYVAYTADNQSFKIKSPYYLTNKWVARNPKIDKILDLRHDIKLRIDEEYHGVIDAIRNNATAYSAMSEQERLAWIRAMF
jgi:hypothetical protein